MPRTNTVVISDVHLSNGATPYSWFKDGSQLKAFLKQTANNPDMKELVLLGDIFDLWIYPVTAVPWTAQQIIQQWSGPDSVVSALKECADKLPDVFYINGNHDMGVTPTDLDLISPKIKFRTADQYNAAHTTTLHLEHGHLVDLFNAPDISGNPVKGLPFGYFITRMMATAGNHDELWSALSDTVMSHLDSLILQHGFMQNRRGQDGETISFAGWTLRLDDWFEALIEDLMREAGKLLIEAVIDLLIRYAKWSDSSINSMTPVRFPDGSSVTLNEVKKHYHNLLLNWYRQLGSLSALRQSALASTNLNWHAEELLQRGPAHLVCMGHTHQGQSMAQPSGQYANSGCWLSGKQATYIEVNPAANPKAVVKTYPGNVVLPPAVRVARMAMAAEAAPVAEALAPAEQQDIDQVK